MLASRLTKGMHIDGKRIAVPPARVVAGGIELIRVRFEGVSTPLDLHPDTVVMRVTTACEPAAGPTPSDTWFVGGVNKPSADPMAGKWRGERGSGGSRMEDAIAIAKAFDAYAA